MANSQTMELKSRISIEDISGPERFYLGEELKSMANSQTAELKSRLCKEDMSWSERFLLGKELKSVGSSLAIPQR